MAASDSFYNELLPEIDGVIDELGTTYNVVTPGVYDNATLTTLPPSTRAVGGLVADQSFTSGFDVSAEVGRWVAVKTLILKADANPKEGEYVVVDGVTYPLTKLVPIKPADIVVLYMLDISR